MVEGQARVPAEGPLIVAANHPNMLLDVLLLAAATDRTLHFLAKATLFRNRILAAFLRLSGVLPVHRQKDRPGPAERNVSTFEACHRLLAEGGAIGIFPEGVSHERDAVLPLKTGCARIALEAEAKHGFTLGTRIVPVGIAFSNRELFRSDALVVFGEPVDPKAHFEAYLRSEAEAVRALTSDVEIALQRVAPHIPRVEEEKLVATLRPFFTTSSSPMGPTGERLDFDRALIEAISHFRDLRPLDYRRLRRRLLGYGRVLQVLGLTHEDLDRTYRLGPVVRYLARRLLLGLLGLAPFLAGALFHYLPYKLPGWIARALAKEPVERATVKLVTGLVVFPAWYALAWVLIGRPFLMAFLPFLGLFTLAYGEAAAGFLREARIFLAIRRSDERRSRLMLWRRELVAELEALRREYQTDE